LAILVFQYNRSHQDSYGRSSRHHDREISDASTQAMRLTREAELLKYVVI